jgi:heme/copper-type cytochrome/quinol oxidase subunit 2
MMWLNLSKNVANWAKGNSIPRNLLGISSAWWFLVIGLLLSAVAVVAIARYRRDCLAMVPASEFGRAQMLFLIVLWVPVIGAFTQAFPGLSNRGVFLVQASFWITAALCSLIVVSLTGKTQHGAAEPRGSSDASWRLSRRFWVCLCLVPILVYVLAHLTLASHSGSLPYNQVRFSHPPAEEPGPARP